MIVTAIAIFHFRHRWFRRQIQIDRFIFIASCRSRLFRSSRWYRSLLRSGLFQFAIGFGSRAAVPVLDVVASHRCPLLFRQTHQFAGTLQHPLRCCIHSRLQFRIFRRFLAKDIILERQDETGRTRCHRIGLLQDSTLGNRENIQDIRPEITDAGKILLCRLTQNLVRPPHVGLESGRRVRLTSRFFLGRRRFGTFLRNSQIPGGDQFLQLREFLFDELQLVRQPLNFSVRRGLCARNCGRCMSMRLGLRQLHRQHFQIDIRLRREAHLALGLVEGLDHLVEERCRRLLRKSLESFTVLLRIVGKGLAVCLLVDQHIPRKQDHLLKETASLFACTQDFLQQLQCRFRLFMQQRA